MERHWRSGDATPRHAGANALSARRIIGSMAMTRLSCGRDLPEIW
jgi:hypothetical protein